MDSDKTTSFTAYIPRELEPLMERYCSNRIKDIEMANALLLAGNIEELRKLGHTMKGGGASYGFSVISEIGLKLEMASKNNDMEGIKQAIGDLKEYMEKVQIVFVEE